MPIVIRGPSGGNTHGGPFHSQNVESFFLNTPGLKIVQPSTAYDAKGLLKAAIRDEDPVLYFEHKYLYRRIKEELPEEDYIVPIGKAAVRRKGTDLGIITYGAMVYTALEAADELAKSGVETEVLDLRTILPLDDEAIMETVAKTNKVIVLHEACLTGGAGGEIVARIIENAFDFLDGPVIRVAAQDSPVPYSPPMEQFFLPQVDDVLTAARKLLDF